MKEYLQYIRKLIWSSVKPSARKWFWAFLMCRPSGACSCKGGASIKAQRLKALSFKVLHGPRGERDGMWHAQRGKSLILRKKVALSYPGAVFYGIMAPSSSRACSAASKYAHGEMKIISHIIVPYIAYSKAWCA